MMREKFNVSSFPMLILKLTHDDCVNWQKEEEKRRQEERRKAEQERQQLEKERKDREAKEAALREKRDKEKASQIEQQKYAEPFK